MEKFYANLKQLPHIYWILIATIYTLIASYFGIEVAQVSMKAVMTPEMASAMPSDEFLKITTILSSIVGTLIIILVISGLYYGLTLIFKRDIKFVDFLKINGYSLIFQAITTAICYYWFIGQDFSWVTSKDDLVIFQKELTNYSVKLLPFSVISGLFVAGAIKHWFSLEWWKAFLVAFIPVCGSLLYTYYKLVMEEMGRAIMKM